MLKNKKNKDIQGKKLDDFLKNYLRNLNYNESQSDIDPKELYHLVHKNNTQQNIIKKQFTVDNLFQTLQKIKNDNKLVAKAVLVGASVIAVVLLFTFYNKEQNKNTLTQTMKQSNQNIGNTKEYDKANSIQKDNNQIIAEVRNIDLGSISYNYSERSVINDSSNEPSLKVIHQAIGEVLEDNNINFSKKDQMITTSFLLYKDSIYNLEISINEKNKIIRFKLLSSNQINSAENKVLPKINVNELKSEIEDNIFLLFHKKLEE